MSNAIFRFKCKTCGKVITKYGKSAEILYSVRELLWKYTDAEHISAKDKAYTSVLDLIWKTMDCCEDPVPTYYENEKGVMD